MNLEAFNTMESVKARELLFSSCGSSVWADALLDKRPFDSERSLVEQASLVWYDQCVEKDWLEAFGHHPKIGDVKSIQEKFASTKHLATAEQSGVSSASSETIQALAQANADYEQKFGFIFIVCATGKSAEEMLRVLNERLKNSYEEELHVAMGEQHKITLIRIQKTLKGSNWQWMRNSQITSHVLDTSLGQPAQNMTIRLQTLLEGNTWQTMALAVTNKDGRAPELLPPERILEAGTYRMQFETGEYYGGKNTQCFYPSVGIQFSVFDDQHYHIPLLINPFGYTTYRGS